VSTATSSYEGHRYPVENINRCVWQSMTAMMSAR
jgi:hypothetical protein